MLQLTNSQDGSHLTPVSYSSHYPIKTLSHSQSVRVTLRANQFALATNTLRPTIKIFIFELNTCSYIPYVISSLTRGWVCSLQLLLCLASAVILRSEPRHILMSQTRDFTKLEGQVPVFRLHPSGTCCPGYTPVTGFPFRSQIATDGQSVHLPWCRAPLGTVMSIWGTLSDEKTGLSFVRVTFCSNTT
jgi:hypothetical protein